MDMRIGTKRSSSSGQPGFTLPELLIVLAIAGLALVIAVPLAAEQIRTVQSHAAAGQLATDIRAARMIAVSKRSTVTLQVDVDPTNAYQYTDAHGRVRRIALPKQIRIVSSSPPISFGANGALAAAATTVLEASVSGGVIDRFTVATSLLGVPTVTHQRVYP